jgi:MFS transporter, putative metabolite:H+ symporter
VCRRARRTHHLELTAPAATSPALAVALLVVGINGVIAMLLPYAAESYPMPLRGRATGWVAACTKAGSLRSLLALVPALAASSLLVLVPVVIGFLLLLRYGAETRGRDLRDLEGRVAMRNE